MKKAFLDSLATTKKEINTTIPGMHGYKSIKEIVVIGSGKLLCSPCGGCRQRIREFANLEIKIHMCNTSGHLKTSTLEELLPYSFGPENL